MLDLPLRSGERQADLPFGPDRLRPEKPQISSPPPHRRPRPRRSKKRWVWIFGSILVLVVVALLVLWPKPPEPSFSANPFVLEKVRVGQTGELQTLTITNVGEKPMLIDLLSLGTRLLEPQASCEVQVRFTPLGMGVRHTTAELHAQMPESPARLDVRGEGLAPILTLDPASAVFGSQDVGSNSEPLDLVASNQGTAPLKISRVALTGAAERDFRLTRNECSKSTLTPGQTCGLRLVFVPRAAGERQAKVVLTSDALEPETAAKVTGEGIWTGAAFAVEPRSIEFGPHLVGTGGLRKRVQVVNRQGRSLRNLRVELADRNRGFSLGSQSCAGQALAPGESCQIEVGFDPANEGDFDSLLEISQRDVGTLGITLSGKGVAPRWVLGTRNLVFGDTRVEEASDNLEVALRNEGSAAAQVNEVELTGPDANGFKMVDDRCSGREVSPGSGCSLQIRFEPRREGQHGAEILLRPAAGTSPQRVSLVAQAIAPRLSLDQEMVDFDRVHRSTVRQIELRLSNRGTASLQLESLTIDEDSTGDFRILGGSCPTARVLPAGLSCTVEIGYGPTIEGRATARLRIEHDGISGPREVPLAGIGLPPPIPKLIVETSSLEFGPQPIGNRSTIQTVNLRAGGTGNLQLREFTLEGTDAADFQIVPATCHAGPSLQPGTACAVGVRFIPSAAGPRSARLVLRHNAGSGVDRIELRGEGLGGPPE
jgi:hypothetical protein